jgi:outer membrane protein TolC
MNKPCVVQPGKTLKKALALGVLPLLLFLLPCRAGQAGALADSRVLTLTVADAVLTALQNNPEFLVQKAGPDKSRADADIARAAFDPVVTGGITAGRTRGEPETGGVSGAPYQNDSLEAKAGIQEFFPTGTTVEAAGNKALDWKEDPARVDGDSASWDARVTQALLRGAGFGANLASLRQARLGVDKSLHELRGAAETLVANVENAYWDYVLALRSVDIYQKSLEVAKAQEKETRERVRLGKLAETELAAARAETASGRAGLVSAKKTLEARRLGLLRLLSLENGWGSAVVPAEEPETPAMALDSAESHVRVALEKRADLAQARIGLKQQQMEVVRTKNGLLPRLDLFIGLGGTRYAESFKAGQDTDLDEIATSAGLELELPVGNREARAKHAKAVVSESEAALAIKNLEDLAQVDTRTAFAEAGYAAEEVKAKRALAGARELAFEVEREKVRLGRSTAFQVSQAQRDMLEARLGETEALCAYRKALTALFRLEGSLLERRGIRAW